MATVMMGHTGPTTSKRKEAKKFWFQIVFCEMTPMDDILARLEALTPTDAAAEQKKSKLGHAE
jgi:hypothetical protein